MNLANRPTPPGGVVTGIDAASPAADSDLRPGDVIVQVNRQPVRTVAEYRRQRGACANGRRPRPSTAILSGPAIS